MKYRRAFTQIALVVLLSRASASASAQGDVVAIAGGQIKGVKEANVIAFKGVPFAAAPVGALRWRAPQSVRPWQGVRSASMFGADCAQVPAAQGLTHLQTTPSEDCLYLNIWAPATSPVRGKHAVMVWI